MIVKCREDTIMIGAMRELYSGGFQSLLLSTKKETRDNCSGQFTTNAPKKTCALIQRLLPPARMTHTQRLQIYLNTNSKQNER